MKIDFANLIRQYAIYKSDIDVKIQSVLDNASYIMGKEISELESELTRFTGARYAITCSSGTDALLISMMAADVRPGDEVITTPFTFIATAESIALLRAVPVFVDIEPDTFNIDANKIEAAVTNKTKIIMPVSLYGQPADMDAIQLIADKHNLKVVVDGAQSFGARYKDKTDSNLGAMSTTSFFPAKPLGCYGDGGAVFTNNELYADKLKMLRVHEQNKRYHHKYIGIGGRLDTIQAAVLLAKLPYYISELEARELTADKYTNALDGIIRVPTVMANRKSVWAQYTVLVKNRDRFQLLLKNRGVPTSVHYPMPLHQQECFKYLNLSSGEGFPVAEKISQEVMSLPMNPFITDIEFEYIVDQIKYCVNVL